MVYRVVEVCLDRDLLACLVSGAAATMSAIEIMKDSAPRLGIAPLICKTADGAGDHAVYNRLVVVRIRPPGTGPIPGNSRRIVRPGDSAQNYAARNTQGANRRTPRLDWD